MRRLFLWYFGGTSGASGSDGDFARANAKVKEHDSNFTKPGDYTWHYLDDMKIVEVNGVKEYHCTMQLVETNKHANSGGTGNAHTGSPKQYDNSTETSSYK